MARLLSVDWDYFFPIIEQGAESFMYDWGRSESPLFMQGFIWNQRASSFMASGLDLPTVNDEWRTFWDGFRFEDGAKLYVADSHAFAAEPRLLHKYTRGGSIWNFDAHHDCGYSEEWKMPDDGAITCDMWLAIYTHFKARTHVVYPKWRDWREMEQTAALNPHMRCTDNGSIGRDGMFGDVFICRSSAWTPPWCDEMFDEFVMNCPVDDVEVIDELCIREFSEDEAVALADSYKKMMKGE